MVLRNRNAFMNYSNTWQVVPWKVGHSGAVNHGFHLCCLVYLGDLISYLRHNDDMDQMCQSFICSNVIIIVILSLSNIINILWRCLSYYMFYTNRVCCNTLPTISILIHVFVRYQIICCGSMFLVTIFITSTCISWNMSIDRCISRS